MVRTACNWNKLRNSWQGGAEIPDSAKFNSRKLLSSDSHFGSNNLAKYETASALNLLEKWAQDYFVIFCFVQISVWAYLVCQPKFAAGWTGCSYAWYGWHNIAGNVHKYYSKFLIFSTLQLSEVFIFIPWTKLRKDVYCVYTQFYSEINVVITISSYELLYPYLAFSYVEPLLCIWLWIWNQLFVSRNLANEFKQVGSAAQFVYWG